MSGSWTDNQVLLLTLFTTYIFGLSIQVVLKAGTFSLASAGTWSIGAYISAQMTLHGHPWLLSVFVAMVAAGLVATVLAFVFGRLSGLFLGMATIAFDLLMVSLAQTWTWATGGSLGLYAIPMDPTAGQVLIVAVVATVVVELLQLGAGGRATDTVREDATLASAVGIDVGGLRRRTMVLSGVLGGLAGALVPLVYGVVGPNDGGFSLVVSVLTVVVLGGMRSWVGVAIGAILVTWLPEWLSFVSKWRDLVYGVLIVVMVIFAPQGLTDVARRAVRFVIRWRRPDQPITPEPASPDADLAEGESASESKPVARVGTVEEATP